MGVLRGRAPDRRALDSVAWDASCASTMCAAARMSMPPPLLNPARTFGSSSACAMQHAHLHAARQPLDFLMSRRAPATGESARGAGTHHCVLAQAPWQRLQHLRSQHGKEGCL